MIKYKDKVKFKKGFYKDNIGIVVDAKKHITKGAESFYACRSYHKGWPDEIYYLYSIKLEDGNIVNDIADEDISKI
jgi:hypothetical protein